MSLRVFLDDERNPPIGEVWTVVRTAEDLLDIVARRGREITEISLDNDLQLPMEGIHALNAIKELVLDDAYPLPALERVTVHSMNGEAARAMLADLLLYKIHGILPGIEIRRRAPEGRLYPLASDDDRCMTIHRREE